MRARLEVDIQWALPEGYPEPLPTETELACWVAAAVPEDRPVALCIRIVDEPESQALNRDYRGRDRPTNVLSFPFEPPPGMTGPHPLGDLAICAPVVAREAREQGKAAQAHWAHMVVHGTLHLLGYDHINDRDAEIMEALEARILQRLGFPHPYDTESA